MYKLVFLFCSIFLANATQAQQVVFFNPKLNKTITVKPGAKVFLGYIGYNGNTEFAANTVTAITDSTITLGVDLSFWFPKRKPSASTNNYKTILLKDITHFRKRSFGGEMIKSTMQIGAAVGSVFLLSDLYRSTDVSRTGAVLISIGAGALLNLTAKIIFPENAKYRIQDGWIINPKPNEVVPIGRN
jgi:hypothetical protein